MTTALVTGGSGFFGKFLVKEVIGHKDKVILYDLKQPSYALDKWIQYIKGDILDIARLKQIIKKVDVIYHLASIIPPIKSKSVCQKVNVEGTRAVFAAALPYKHKVTIVHISSSAVYGVPKDIPIKESTPHNPLGCYAETKEEQEKICIKFRKRGLKITIMRPRSIIGGGLAGSWLLVFKLIQKNLPVPMIGNGKNIVQHTSGEDFAKACVMASHNPNQEFNIGADRFLTLNDDINHLIKLAHSKSRIIHFPARICQKICYTADSLGISLLDKNQYLTYNLDYYFDISHAKKVLGFAPKDSNAEMLKRAYCYFNTHQKKN